MAMRAGQLRHQVVLQRRTVTRSAGHAAMAETWTNWQTVWAKIEPLSGRELLQAQQTQAETTHEIVIRYVSELTPRDRVRFGTRVFEILSIINRDERNEMLTLQCVERQGADGI
jgi:SPP1 family predicted phage head-tail adaptor